MTEFIVSESESESEECLMEKLQSFYCQVEYMVCKWDKIENNISRSEKNNERTLGE